MNIKNTLILTSFLFILPIWTFAQRPQVILPNTSKSISAEKDTLWIITGKQFKKTIITSRKLKFCEKKLNLIEQQNDTLKQISAEKQILIDTLKHDKEYYQKIWNKSENDLEFLSKMYNNQAKKTKISIIIGASAAVVAFIAGLLIGLK